MKELCPAEALHEECGVFGIYDSTGKTNMVSAVYSALYALQHRGQESCGIALNVDGVLTGYRDLGLVSEVFTPRVLADLPQDAKMATGHVRYATSGQRTRANAQPMVLHHCKGAMAICHNGNLTNAPQLRHKLEMNGSIFHGTSDTEVIGYLLTQNRLISPDIETAVCRTMEQIVGAYSLVIMTHTKLIAARDPNGFRPLCIGQLPDGSGWAFASESCALDAVGARFVRDVLPGEIVVADYTGLRTIRTHCGTAPHTMCVFEYIYFARPDSIIEGTCVHDARLQAGRFLAQEHPVEADVVIGAPDSGLDAALGYAQESGIPYGVGFIKNKYVGRTFIQGSQAQRESSVRIKLNAISSTVAGKRVVLVDDSIVRGTTSARTIKLLRDAGAKPLVFLDYIACGRNIPEKIAEIVKGVAEGCVQAGCSLVGGETAEHPGMMPEDEYDLAGFTVGVVDKAKILSNADMQAGDVLIALPSTGVHSNGFSLVRKIFDIDNHPEVLQKTFAGMDKPLGEALLAPTRIYVKPVLALLDEVKVKGISHITGGGFYENIPRSLKDGCAARIAKADVRTPALFDVMQREGGISEHDMFNTFNMGVGMVVTVAAEDADKAIEILQAHGEDAYRLGTVVEGSGVELV